MPIVLAIPATAGMTTFATLIQECAERLAFGKWPAASTSTGTGTTSTIVDSALNDTRDSASLARFEDVFVRTLISTTENVRKVMSFAPNTPSGSATLTVAPVMTGAHPTATAYTVHYVCHPSDLKEDINKCLRKMRYSALFPLSILDDPDMERNRTVSGDWGSSGATVTKDKTSYERGNMLKVLDTGGANGYASQTAHVIENEVYYLFGIVKTDEAATEANLQAYDTTAGAEIDVWDSDELGYTEVGGKFTIPTGCKALSVRAITVTTSKSTYWDNLQLWGDKQVDFRLPIWITSPNQIGDVYCLPIGTAAPDENTALRQTKLRRFCTPRIYEVGNGVYGIQISRTSDRPLFLETYSPYVREGDDELSSDTDTTTANEFAVVAGACYLACKRQSKDFKAETRDFLDEWAGYYRPPEPFGRFGNG